MARHLATSLLIAALLWPQASTGESGSTVDRQFAAFELASVPLPGTSDELIVAEEPTLEVFLSPSDFPDALARLTLSGVSADFAINFDLSTLRGEALPDRVQWPELGGRPLSISAPSEGGSLTLTPVTPRPSVTEDELADQELQLQWFLEPEEGEPEGPLRGRARAVRLATNDGQTLATWIAAPPQEGCTERVEAMGAPRCHVSGVSRAVEALSVDVSGRWVAVAGGDLRPRVDIWELSSFAFNRRITFPPWQGPPIDVEFTQDGQLIVVDAVGTIHLWNASSGGEHRRFDPSARAVALLDMGRLIAVADAQGGLSLWLTDNGTIAARLGRSNDPGLYQLASSGDGQRLAAVSRDEDQLSVEIWQIDDGQVVGRARVSGGIVEVALDGAGEHLWAAHGEQGLLRARVGPSSSLAPFGGDAGRRCRSQLALSPDDRLVACALERGAAVFDVDQGRVLHTLGADERTGHILDTIVFSPDGASLIATGGGELLEWPLSRSERRRE